MDPIARDATSPPYIHLFGLSVTEEIVARVTGGQRQLLIQNQEDRNWKLQKRESN